MDTAIKNAAKSLKEVMDIAEKYENKELKNDLQVYCLKIAESIVKNSDGYVEMAKGYRQWIIDRGGFKSLEEKAEAVPQLRDSCGGVDVSIGFLKHDVRRKLYEIVHTFEEGIALVDDKTGRHLALRSFDLARIFLEEKAKQSRNSGAGNESPGGGEE